MAQPRITIIKASGAREHFNRRKLERSIQRSGASRGIARITAMHVAQQLRDGMTTAEIFALVRGSLRRKREHGAAARYTLKDAMYRLGPAGYHFEKYVAEILRAYGYDAVLPDLIPGMCVEHEVDVVARLPADSASVATPAKEAALPRPTEAFRVGGAKAGKGPTTAMAECKYRNAPGLRVHLKDVMATWARYEDLREAYAKRRHRFNFTECWIVCNTKITGDGLAFGNCKGMRFIGWQYPRDAGLERMIEEKHLYPITVLRTLTPFAQEQFAAAGVMLCHDIAQREPQELSRRTGVPVAVIERIRQEITEVLRC